MLNRSQYKINGSLEINTTNPNPVIECYHPTVKNELNKVGVIIFPGGGYWMLASHEGEGYADYFRQQGLYCFVVTYRLGSDGNRHPAMIEDAMAAIETIRKHARQMNLSLEKLGVMGSSAGGHLAALSMVSFSSFTSNETLRPDFGILCYPVILMDGPLSHNGSRCNLLGSGSTDRLLLSQVSPVDMVKLHTPPCFLWHTGEDSTVPQENSLAYAAALRDASVPCEIHIYQKGVHGLGLQTPFRWENDALRWIKELF